MDIGTLKELFEANLNPLREDVKELKEGQLQLIEIIKVQTMQEATIQDMRGHVEECTANWKEFRKNNSNRLWEVIKLFIAGTVGAVISKMF